MRRSLGWIVFFGGVVALGYWAHEDHAVRIEKAVLADLKTIDLNEYEDVQARVSGRDITLEGRVQDAEARDALLTALAELPSHRFVHEKLEIDG
jgi:hypothetical protein